MGQAMQPFATRRTKPERIPADLPMRSVVNRYRAVALIAGLMLAGSAPAEQVLEMKGTTITGDPGLPKVLYIVPWQRPKLNNLDQGLVLHSLADYVLEPVDPGLLERERRYGSVYFSTDAGASAK